MSIKKGTVLQKKNVLYLVKEIKNNIAVAWLCYEEEGEFVAIKSVTRRIDSAEIKNFNIAGEAKLIAG